MIDGGAVLASWSTRETNTHAEVLASGVERVLTEAGLRGGRPAGVVVGAGPGPFTGLRIGLALAQSLVCVWDVPLYGVCSLDSLALQAIEAGAGQDEFAVTTDARRREVYWASYHALTGGPAGPASAYPQRTEGPRVGPAADVPAVPHIVGQGVSLYPEELRRPDALPGSATWLPEAGDLGRIAESALRSGREAAVLVPPRPLYLRESDARVPASMRGAGT